MKVYTFRFMGEGALHGVGDSRMSFCNVYPVSVDTALERRPFTEIDCARCRASRFFDVLSRIPLSEEGCREGNPRDRETVTPAKLDWRRRTAGHYTHPSGASIEERWVGPAMSKFGWFLYPALDAKDRATLGPFRTLREAVAEFEQPANQI